MFRHEYKKFQQLLRHYYVVKLYCLESLYQYSVDRQSFVNEFETGVSKLPIFQQIHNASSENDKKSCFSVESDQKEDSNRSLFKDIANELRKTFTKNDSSENSSKKYKHEPTDFPALSVDEQEQKILSKLDSESSGNNSKRNQCFDIAAQMKGLFYDDKSSSLDSPKFRFLERKTV